MPYLASGCVDWWNYQAAAAPCGSSSCLVSYLYLDAACNSRRLLPITDLHCVRPTRWLADCLPVSLHALLTIDIIAPYSVTLGEILGDTVGLLEFMPTHLTEDMRVLSWRETQQVAQLLKRDRASYYNVSQEHPRYYFLITCQMLANFQKKFHCWIQQKIAIKIRIRTWYM